MNFCIKCGSQLKPDARFCSNCGETTSHNQDVNQSKASLPVCSSCGADLRPGIRFCTNCGTPVPVSPPQAPPPGPQPKVSPVPSQKTVNQKQAIRNVPRKRGRKVLKITLSVLAVGCVVVAALYFYGVHNTKSNVYISALYADEKYDPAKIDSTAKVVEKVFAASDTIGLAKILSPTTLDQKKQFFRELIPYMPAFASDFKSRKLLYATPRYAVYEFSSKGGKFTAEFCLGENGKWLLMRF
jgi:predicted nucleic acid-binding Zn ribbon protein